MAANRTTAEPRTDLPTGNTTWLDIDITGVRDQSVSLVLGDSRRDPTLAVDTAGGDRRYLDLSDVQVDPDSIDDGLRLGEEIRIVQQGAFDEVYVSGIQRQSLAIDYWDEADHPPRLLVHTADTEEPTDIIDLPPSNPGDAALSHGGAD